jgi:hypothetical protein
VTDVVGNAQVLYKTTLPLPDDVPPASFTWTPNNDLKHTGEYVAPLWMHPFAWTEDPIYNYDKEPTLQEPRRPDPLRQGRENNPRDNLVSMIAITTGEEAFEDLNNNGAWDEGELYTDLTEPFVDNNDNGTWDAKERYVDANGNGTWDGKNGKYDSSTLIWVQERILWTGVPHAEDRTLNNPGGRNPKPVIRPLSPDPASLPRVLKKFEGFSATFLVADPWFNSLARNANADGCEAGVVGPVVVAPLTQGVAFTYPAYTLMKYVIKDARDPTTTNIPDYPQPIPFEVTANCVFTASPKEGHEVLILGPLVYGNIPK